MLKQRSLLETLGEVSMVSLAWKTSKATWPKPCLSNKPETAEDDHPFERLGENPFFSIRTFTFSGAFGSRANMLRLACEIKDAQILKRTRIDWGVRRFGEQASNAGNMAVPCMSSEFAHSPCLKWKGRVQLDWWYSVAGRRIRGQV